MSTYARAPKSSTGTRVRTIAAASDAGRGVEPLAPEREDDPARAAPARRTRARSTAAAASSPCSPSISSELSGDSSDRAERRERMRRRRDRDLEVGQRAVRELAAPDERVERVVVDEPVRASASLSAAAPRSTPAAKRIRAIARDRSVRLRAPSPAAREAILDACPRPPRSTAATARGRSPRSSARSTSCARCATPSRRARSTTPTSSSARAAPARRRWRRSSRPA